MTEPQPEKTKIENSDDKDTKEHITLNIFLRINKLAATDGQAKLLARSEAVKVNGIVETRKKKKLSEGDVVEVKGQKFVVKIEK